MFADMGAVIPEPSGTVKAFYGAVGDIPDGWALCDGTNGTPNMINKFIVGAGSIYDLGEVAGNSSHAHLGSFAGHTHHLNYMANAQAGNSVFASPYQDTQEKAGTISMLNENHIPPCVGLYFMMKL